MRELNWVYYYSNVEKDQNQYKMCIRDRHYSTKTGRPPMFEQGIPLTDELREIFDDCCKHYLSCLLYTSCTAALDCFI